MRYVDFDPDGFVEECKFARVVGTEKGGALLIGGHVIEVRGCQRADIAELLARALCKGAA